MTPEEGDFQAQELVTIIVGSLVAAAAGWGLGALSEWMKGWADQSTLLHSLNHAYLPAGDQLEVWLGHADDQASLWFNNENVINKALKDEGTWMIPASRVRKGPNLLVLAIDNIGRGHFGAHVVTRRASTKQVIPEMCISLQGDEGPFVGNKHLIYVQLIGR